MSSETNGAARQKTNAANWLSGKTDRDPEAVEIRELCARAGMPEVADRLIFAGLSLDDVRETLIDALAAGQQSAVLAG